MTEVTVLGGGLSRFARERADGTPVDWVVEAGLDAIADAGAELQAYEDLGLCAYGQSGPLAEQGAFDLGGDIATNTSGGLIGQGAPPGAAGLAQAIEVMRQLRGECPPERQVPGARRGLTDIHGGTASFAAVSVLERAD